jgi:hypothetical protein
MGTEPVEHFGLQWASTNANGAVSKRIGLRYRTRLTGWKNREASAVSARRTRSRESDRGGGQ